MLVLWQSTHNTHNTPHKHHNYERATHVEERSVLRSTKQLKRHESFLSFSRIFTGFRLRAATMKGLFSALFLSLLGSRDHTASAHPDYLECNGLSNRIAHSQTIMSFKPKLTSPDDAPVIIQRHESGDAASVNRQHGHGKQQHLTWTNYTFIGTTDDLEFVVEVIPHTRGERANITAFGHGICGSDPKHPGRGLCQKCATQLYAEGYDCVDNEKCLFGVSGEGNVSVLVAWSDAGYVGYAHFDLS